MNRRFNSNRSSIDTYHNNHLFDYEKKKTFRFVNIFNIVTNGRRKYHRRLQVFLIVFIILLLLISYSFLGNFVQIGFWVLRNHAYEKKWWTALLMLNYRSCSIRKSPFLFVLSSKNADLVWEMLCPPANNVSIEWYTTDLNPSDNRYQHFSIIVQPINLNEAHWVYRAHLEPLRSNTWYQYEIFSIANGKRIWYYPKTKIYWIGESGNSTIHIGIISDNQSGVRNYMTVLHSLANLPASYPRQYIASDTDKVFPHYLIHAGDAVQSYNSLEQWQTDFADPLSFAWNHRSPPPILYAHGNHDEDATNRYVYTTGQRQGKNWFSVTLGTVRFLVLDSQPVSGTDTQLDWLQQETRSTMWKRASFRIVVVHIAPFIEYWDPRTWEKLGEKRWGFYVRTKLLPILIDRGVGLIISGHQHAYSRGWMPKEIGKWLVEDESDIDMNNSTTRKHLRSIASHSKKKRNLQDKNNFTYSIGQLGEGTMMTIVGGAGGELDSERVEDWGFYETSIRGRHHFAVITLNREGLCLTWRAYDMNAQLIDRFDLIQ